MRILSEKIVSAVASIVLTAGIVTFADPAIASVPATAASRVQVGYADLDLAAPAGRATLERRVHSAASEVCGADDGDQRFASLRCQAAATADADRQIAVVTAAAGEGTTR